MHGIGCDIIEISRVKSAIEKHGRVFLNKIFTASEQLYCEKHRFSEERYAARFAAKEAISKALGTGFGEHLSFLDIEITASPSGKPEVKLSDHANERFSHPKIHLSLSHSKISAMAFAVVE